MAVNAGDVLIHYYKLRQEHGGAPAPQYFRKKTWACAEQYLAWCSKNQVEPLGFLELVFKAGRISGRIPVLWRLRSNKLLEIWRSNGEGAIAEERAGAKLMQRAGTRREQAIKNLKINTRGMESMRRHYAAQGTQQLCLLETDLTGGYHPESQVCPACPFAVQCSAGLYQRHGFDVVSLRAGRLYALPSDVAAAAVR
jgi:hypothetical protein